MSQEFAILMITVGTIFIVLYFVGLSSLLGIGVGNVVLSFTAKHNPMAWTVRLFGLVEILGAATAINAAVGRYEWLTLFAATVVVAIFGTMINNHENSLVAKKMTREMAPNPRLTRLG